MTKFSGVIEMTYERFI